VRLPISEGRAPENWLPTMYKYSKKKKGYTYVSESC
jgi:hypothetical protein